MTYMFMLAYQNVKVFNPKDNQLYEKYYNKTGHKQHFRAKIKIVQEIKRWCPNPNIWQNVGNSTIDQLME